MSNDIKPINTLIKSVNLYTNRMRKSRKETIKTDLSSFIQWLTLSLENKSYDENDNLENINLNIIEPFFIEQYVKITNLKHSNQNASKNVTMLVFTEFGRRMRDNGSGTDHGSGGGAFIIGDRVNGGLYSEYPSIDPADWLYGEDLKHTIDFRGIYGTVLEQWLGVEAAPVVGGSFEQITPFSN